MVDILLESLNSDTDCLLQKKVEMWYQLVGIQSTRNPLFKYLYARLSDRSDNR